MGKRKSDDAERLKGRIPGDAAEFLDGPGLSYSGEVPVIKLKDGTTLDLNKPVPDVFGEEDSDNPDPPREAGRPGRDAPQD